MFTFWGLVKILITYGPTVYRIVKRIIDYVNRMPATFADQDWKGDITRGLDHYKKTGSIDELCRVQGRAEWECRTAPRD